MDELSKEEMTLERVTSKLQDRWAKLEDKSCQIESMLSELEEAFKEYADDSDIKYTKAYLMLETKLHSIRKEQDFIENLFRSINP